MDKVKELRRKHPTFIYESYEWALKRKDLVMSFRFLLEPNIRFFPHVVIKSVPQKRLRELERNGMMDNLVFHLGLAEIPSYWKAAASPMIEIEAGYLDSRQKKWWKKLILKGMGEYFYVNDIDFTPKKFLTITSVRKAIHKTKIFNFQFSIFKNGQNSERNNVLVPVGGGKDSVVTLELLKKKFPVRIMMLNPTERMRAVARKSKTQNPIVIERAIDPALLALNKRGYLNGHTPFSAYLAFLSVLCAALFDYRFVAVSNERSASEGNVAYKGQVVNHQYSKSHEFEKDFRGYSKRYLNPAVLHFSFLRPLSELQIAYAFALVGTSYFPHILSCNRGQKTGQWCGKCSKCLFTYIVLHPFVETAALRGIFGGDLFCDKTLRRTLDELIGIKRHKPFECVGTHEEVKEALSLSIRALEAKRKKLPFLLAYALSNVRLKTPATPRN